MNTFKKTRYQTYLVLTGEESMKLQELSKKLKLRKSKMIGLLIMKAQIIETTSLVDESLVIQKGQSDVN